MRSLIPIMILSTLLTACNRESNNICDKNNTGMEGGGIIPPFNFISITQSEIPGEKDNKPSELIFRWTGDTQNINYTVCVRVRSTEFLEQCKPLVRVSNTNEAKVELESLIEDGDEDLFILAEKTGATPVQSNDKTIDQVLVNSLIQYIKSSNTAPNDSFGYAVVLSQDGKTLAVSATNKTVETFSSAGAVYIYRKKIDKWTHEKFLTASHPGKNDKFGHSLSLSSDGNILAVGAIGESSNAKGVNTGVYNNDSLSAGAVYIFKFDSIWKETAYIKASNTEVITLARILNNTYGDEFGHSVSLSEDGKTLAVGARYERSGDINDQQNNAKPLSGAVYIFRYTNDWKQELYLKASNIGEQDYFGFALNLSVNGNKLAVGAPGEANSTNNFDTDDALKPGSGAVYIFDILNNNLSQLSYIKASNIGKNDFFGSAVDFSEDGKTLASGAHQEGSKATGIDGPQIDDPSGDQSGAVYLYRDDGNNTWRQEAYIKASNTRLGDNFGFALSISDNGNFLAVGAHSEDSTLQGIYGIPTDYTASFSGAVYFLTYDQNQGWKHDAYIKAPNSKKSIYFGQAVSLSGDGNILAVAAEKENSDARNVNGDQINMAMPSAGAVYIY